MGPVRAIARALREQAAARKQWLILVGRSPADASISWNAVVLGKVQVGPRSAVRDGAVLDAGRFNPASEHIRLGAHTKVERGAQIYSWGGFVEIGDDCSINPYCVIYGTGGVRIGSHVRIAAHTIIVASEHRFERLDVPIIEQGYRARGISIGDDVWIGAGCRILDGVTIGAQAIVAAGAVVADDVEPLTIVGGVPARVIRSRAAAAGHQD